MLVLLLTYDQSHIECCLIFPILSFTRFLKNLKSIVYKISEESIKNYALNLCNKDVGKENFIIYLK